MGEASAHLSLNKCLIFTGNSIVKGIICMEKLIKNTLKSAKADYVEIRVHEGVSTGITYVGKELENIGENAAFGGCVRALVKGGWGFVAFKDIENIPRYVDMACEQARFVGTKESQLAPVPPINDHLQTTETKSPSGNT